VKAIKIACLVTIITAVFLSIGTVSAALSSNDVTITAYLTNSSPRPGDDIIVNVNFDSKVNEELQIYYIGIHADWMQPDQLQGPNYSQNPVTLNARGVYALRFLASVPVGTSLGSHSYYIGVDGSDPSRNSFSINSATSELQVVSSSSSATPTPTSNQGDGTGSQGDWLPYVVVGVVAVVVVIIVVLTMLRGRKKREPAVSSTDEVIYDQPTPTEPDTEQEPSSKEEDFSI
jgi:hypothetical protein